MHRSLDEVGLENRSKNHNQEEGNNILPLKVDECERNERYFNCSVVEETSNESVAQSILLQIREKGIPHVDRSRGENSPKNNENPLFETFSTQVLQNESIGNEEVGDKHEYENEHKNRKYFYECF